MARKTHVVLIDDIDGTDASQTIEFGLDGVTYEIDLNDEHAAQLREALGTWIEKGRRTGGRRSAARSAVRGARRSSSQNDALRAWARANGYDVKDRGRVSAEVRAAYEAATK